MQKIEVSHTDGLCLLQPDKRCEELIKRIGQLQNVFAQLAHALQLWG